MEYLNFEVQISAAGDDTYKIRVRSPEGEDSAPMEFRRDELKMPLQRLLTASRGSSPDVESDITEPNVAESNSEESDPDVAPGQTRLSVTHTKRPLGVPTEPATKTARTVGQSLFKTLLPSEKLRTSYQLCLAQAKQQDPPRGLRVRLKIENPELASLPWEFAFDALRDQHLSLAVETPITRYLDVLVPPKTLSVEPPFRILAMIASPTNLEPLNTEKERSRMEAATEHLTDSGRIEIHWVKGQTAFDLATELNKNQFHVLHYIGHGGFDTSVDAEGQVKGGYLSFADADDLEDQFTAEQLGVLLAGSTLNLVVLNSCNGARSSKSNLFSSTAATLIKDGLPAVVSMQYSITDDAAIEFSRSFYGSLAEGNPVDYAVQKSRQWIRASKQQTVEWATPVLFLRAPDGRLFEIERNALLVTDQIQTVPHKRPVGIAVTHRPQDLVKLINRLQTELDKSDWNIENRIESDFEAIGDRSYFQDEISPHSIHQYLNNNGGVVLVLAEPGAGKTTTLRQLYVNQLKLAQQDASQPIPVLINLSSWDHTPLDQWLAEQITDKHRMPTDKAKAWIKASFLQFYLDGLDEIRPKQREVFPAVFDQFAEQAGLAGIVISCREKEYRELPNRITFYEAIRLKSLSPERIQLYLDGFGPELDGLRDALKTDSSLEILARTPLMLSLMVKVYRDWPTQDLADDSPRTAHTRRQELMKAYVKMMFDKQRTQQND